MSLQVDSDRVRGALRAVLDLALPPLAIAAAGVAGAAPNRDAFEAALRGIGETLPGSPHGVMVIGCAWLAVREDLPAPSDRQGYHAVEAVVLSALVSGVLAPLALRRGFATDEIDAQDLARALLRGVSHWRRRGVVLSLASDLAAPTLGAAVVAKAGPEAAASAWVRLVDKQRDEPVAESVRRVAVNERRTRGAARHRDRGREAIALPLGDEDGAVSADPGARVDAADALAVLRPDELEIVKRIKLYGESYREAALALRISDKTAKVRYEKAERKLRRALGL